MAKKDDPQVTTQDTPNDAQQPQTESRSAFRLPLPAQIAAARVAKKLAGESVALPAGAVIDLPAGWVAAKLDPALDEGRKAVLRAKWQSKGWVKVEGLQQVVGYPLGAEVWVKTQSDFDADRAVRDERLQELARSGQFVLGMA